VASARLITLGAQARQIDLTNEDNLFYAKTGYALAIIIVALIYGVVYTRIVGTKGMRGCSSG